MLGSQWEGPKGPLPWDPFGSKGIPCRGWSGTPPMGSFGLPRVPLQWGPLPWDPFGLPRAPSHGIPSPPMGSARIGIQKGFNTKSSRSLAETWTTEQKKQTIYKSKQSKRCGRPLCSFSQTSTKHCRRRHSKLHISMLLLTSDFPNIQHFLLPR